MQRFIIFLTLLGMAFGFLAFDCSSTELTSAKLYIQQENLPKAKESLLKEIQKNPKSDEGEYLLGYVYGEEGDFEKMLEHFDKSLKISNKFEKNIRDWRKNYWADNFNKGVAFFNKASKVGTEDSTKMYYDKAIQSFNYAMMCEPDSADTYKNLVFAYLNAHQEGEAIVPLKKLISMEGKPESYTMLADIYTKEGDDLWQLYQENNSPDDSVKAMNYYNMTIDLLEDGRKLHPNNSDILLFLSNAYIKANKIDVAMDAFKAGVQQDPNNQFYRYNYGVLLLGAADYSEAAQQFEKAVEIDPEYTNAVYNLAVTYVRWGTSIRDSAEAAGVESDAYKEKFKDAMPYLEKYLEQSPEDSTVWELLGKVYANLGFKDKSMDAFNKADEYRK